MKSKNLRTFVVNEKEMIFNVSMFQMLFKKRTLRNNMTFGACEEALANHLFVDKSAVHNWRMNVNGPGDFDRIRQIAEFLNVDYMILLTEAQNMNMVEKNSTMKLSDSEKGALKNVYRTFMNYMNTFDRTTGFLYNQDGSEYPFSNAYVMHDNLCRVLQYEYIDLKRTVYDELEQFFNGRVTYTLVRYTEDGYEDDDEFDGETPEMRTAGLVEYLWKEFYAIIDKYLVA